MATLLLVLIFLVLLVALWAVRSYWLNRGLPPLASGAIPLLGHYYDIQTPEQLHQKNGEWNVVVGPIFRTHAGLNETWINVTGFELIKEVLYKEGDRFSYRPSSSLDRATRVGFDLPFDYGIITASGERWKEQRRFALGVLREFGFGRNKMESKVSEEVDKLLEWMEEVARNNEMCDPDLPLKYCVANIIASVALGRSYSRKEPEFVKLQNALDKVFKLSTSSGVTLLAMIPFLQQVPYLKKLSGLDLVDEANRELITYYRQIIKEHKAEFQPEGEAADFVDAYLKQMHNATSDAGSYFSEDQLLLTITDLWAAGMETTAHTSRWALLYMIHHPDVQEKCFDEISRTVGLNRRTTLEDRPMLPYVQATLNEVQRMCNVLNATVFHTCAEDATLGGYRIPAGSIIVPWISAVHLNEQFFPDPTHFLPQRFLDASGQLRKDDHLIPFGMGKRVCMGESLARMEIFLIFTALIQRFKFSVVDGQQPPPLKAQYGLTLSPLAFQCKITIRDT